MAKKPKAPKNRNPFVQHIRLKVSGAHGKSKKAERRLEKIKMKKGTYDGNLP